MMETEIQEACRKLVAAEVAACVSMSVARLCELDESYHDEVADAESAAFRVECRCGACGHEWNAGRDAGSLPECPECGDYLSVACEEYYPEVYEHWLVSDWLAGELRERGEVVFDGLDPMPVWGRQTTGQAILLDGVIRDIVTDRGAG